VNGTFEFKQCITLLKSTGKRAKTLRELREHIAVISGRSLIHHTCEYFLKGHVLEYTNDFAHWAGESLEESALGEHLSGIDPYDFRDAEELRGDILRVIDEYLAAFPEPREVLPGDAFYFNETVTVVFSAGIRARNLAEFLMAVRHIDQNAIYYHYFDARRRRGDGRDDFSAWLAEAMRQEELGRRIASIDPFMHSIEGIREHIVSYVEDTVRSDMESSGVTG
jgi:Family of unknown function (DUF5752)